MDDVNQAAFVEAVGAYVRETEYYGGPMPATEKALGRSGVAAQHVISAALRAVEAMDALVPLLPECRHPKSPHYKSACCDRMTVTETGAQREKRGGKREEGPAQLCPGCRLVWPPGRPGGLEGNKEMLACGTCAALKERAAARNNLARALGREAQKQCGACNEWLDVNGEHVATPCAGRSAAHSGGPAT